MIFAMMIESDSVLDRTVLAVNADLSHSETIARRGAAIIKPLQSNKLFSIKRAQRLFGVRCRLSFTYYMIEQYHKMNV